ncbi:nuclear transport factor 2 family protein [Limibacter armeniacum]|uniref:nuclear transport factor 2 family protein n=1 Tax=Limibacter armeniacum TaxID=466084 RepID=UPI002FE5359A
MNHKLFLASAIASSLFLGSCNSSDDNNIDSENMEKDNPKVIALKAQDAFFKDYSTEGVETYFAENYIQHNPYVPTGRQTVIDFLPALQQAGTTATTHRILQDGNLVVMHNTYNNAEAFGAKEIVTFDVYRVEEGKVAEHWDNISPIVEETASGRSQFDGPTEITDKEKTAENKELVSNFVNDILMGHDPNKITDYISTEKYYQHNVAIEDGLDGLGKAIDYLVSQNDMFTYRTLHKVLGEGNFVFSMSEGDWHGKPHAFFDLFRIENGKIVEHWDVISEIPAEMAHENGKF